MKKERTIAIKQRHTHVNVIVKQSRFNPMTHKKNNKKHGEDHDCMRLCYSEVTYQALIPNKGYQHFMHSYRKKDKKPTLITKASNALKSSETGVNYYTVSALLAQIHKETSKRYFRQTMNELLKWKHTSVNGVMCYYPDETMETRYVWNKGRKVKGCVECDGTVYVHHKTNEPICTTCGLIV